MPEDVIEDGCHNCKERGRVERRKKRHILKYRI
jgi:hypothetical protein